MSTPPPPFDPTGSSPYPGQQPPPSSGSSQPYPSQPGTPQPYPPQQSPQQPYPSSPTPAGGASGSGGYQPPPAPPLGGPGASRGFDPVESIRYGWLGFTKNIGPYLIVSLVTLLLAGGLSAIGSMIDSAGSGAFGAFDAMDGERTSGTELSIWTFSPASTALNSVSSIITMVISLGMLRMSFDVVEGRKADLSRLFSGYNVGVGIVTAIVVSLLTTLGTFMCIIPGLVFAFLTMFALSGVVDRDEGLGDAIKNSISLTSSNIGPVLLWMLLLFLIAVAAVCTCGVGFLVAIPVFSLSTAYAYRALRGEPIAQPV